MPDARPLSPWSTHHRVALALADDGIGTIPRLMPRMVCAAMADLVQAGLVEKRGHDLYVVSKAGADLRMIWRWERARIAIVDDCEGIDARDARADETWWRIAATYYRRAAEAGVTVAELLAAAKARSRRSDARERGAEVAGVLAVLR